MKWSHDTDRTLFSRQASVLYSTYYLVQTLIYRIFIPPHITSYDFSFPAREICINAAKSCVEIVDRQMRSQLCYIPNLVHTSQVCAGLLLMDIWRLKNQGKTVTPERVDDTETSFAQNIEDLMNDVLVFMGALEWAESRWTDAAQAL